MNSRLEVLDYDHGLIHWPYNIPLFVKPPALSSPDVRIVNVTYGSYFPPWIGRLQKTQQVPSLRSFPHHARIHGLYFYSTDCGLPILGIFSAFPCFGHFDIKHLQNNIRTLKTQKEICKRTLKTQVKGIRCAISRHICWSQHGSILVVYFS